ncbi:response regulator [Pseudorhodobacter ferrugineus]|uniref:response regulator n=1 Tax=Pseudorhodobacter ferrugineus TaxID=77008 RepID=UPI0003F9B15E|nr:response regulator [Pseudorhodobacter ferrugineus]
MPSPLPFSLPAGPGFAAIRPANLLPLSGVTMLAVEDSRFASEALRLLCQRSGVRLRRAETLAAARRHLAVYRPDVVLVDLGLPDGNGVDLIRELTKHDAGACVVLATSGDPDGWSGAMRAGAAGFLEKPLDSLAGFQSAVLQHLTGQVPPPAPLAKQTIHPDTQALQDDLIHAADMVANGVLGPKSYVMNFIRGIARSCHDTALEGAAAQAQTSDAALAGLGHILQQRIRSLGDPFAANPSDPL